MKTFGKGSYKTFPVGTRSKTSFLTSTTAVDIQQIWNIQKQPFRNVLRKTCSEYIQKIYKRTPMVKCNLNKTLLQLCWNCPSPHGSPVKLLHVFSRAPFPQNTSGEILLKIQNRLVNKPKIIQSLSACKNYLINLLASWNDLWQISGFIVRWSKRLPSFLSINT